mgnify:FL=1
MRYVKKFGRFEDESKEESKTQSSEDNPNPIEPFEFERSSLMRPSQKSYLFSFMMINWIFFFVLFGSSILLGIVIGVLEVKDFHRAFDVARTMRDTLKSDPIHSIVSVDPDVTYCPAGYEFLNLGVWTGTKAGCYEPETEKLFAAEECDVDVYYPVSASKPANFTNWKNRKFCVARLRDTDQIPLNYCLPEHKRCNDFCVTKELNCPFHNVTASKGPQLGMTKGGNEEKLQIGDTWLYFHGVSAPGNATDALAYPQQLVGFRVGTKGSWCLDPQRSPEVTRFFGGHKHLGYPLSNQKEAGCGWFGGINGSLDSYIQKKFYEDNQLALEIKDLPLYDKYITNETVDLIPIFKGYSSFQISATEECHVVSAIDEIHIQSLKDVVDNITSKVALGEWLSYTVSAIAACMILVGAVFSKNMDNMRNPELSLAKITSKVLVGLIIICLLFDILTVLQWFSLDKVETWIQSFFHCSVVLKEYNGSPLNVFWGQVGFVVAFVNLTFVITVLFYIYVRKKIKKEMELTKKSFSSYSDISL